MKKLIAVLVATILTFAPTLVLADIEPVFHDGQETYSIGGEPNVVYQLHPASCEAIREIDITFNKTVIADVTIQPFENQQSLGLVKVFATCKVSLYGITAADVANVDLTVRAKQSWLSDNNLTIDNLAFYDYNPATANFEKLSLTHTESKEVYEYFTVKTKYLETWVLGSDIGGQPTTSANLPQVNNFAILLIVCSCLMLLAAVGIGVVALKRIKPKA